MKKFFCSLLVLVLALAMALPAFAAGKLVVSDETMTVCESYSGYTAYIFAVLENTGDKPVEFNAGLIELLDADGESIDAEDYLYSYPTILDPGQKAYLKEYINVDDAESADYIDDYTLSVSGKSASEKYPDYEPCHRIYMQSGVCTVENAGGDIDLVTGKRMTIAAFPFRCEMADGGFVRLVAWEEGTKW